MNLFVWGFLKDRKLLSFILRREYMEPFEPCILNGHMIGQNYQDRLFHVGGSHPDLRIDGFIAPTLSTTDFVKLDRFHALDEGIHMRKMEPVTAMRNGILVQVPVFIYTAGNQFSKIKVGAMQK